MGNSCSTPGRGGGRPGHPEANRSPILSQLCPDPIPSQACLHVLSYGSSSSKICVRHMVCVQQGGGGWVKPQLFCWVWQERGGVREAGSAQGNPAQRLEARLPAPCLCPWPQSKEGCRFSQLADSGPGHGAGSLGSRGSGWGEWSQHHPHHSSTPATLPSQLCVSSDLRQVRFL